MALELSTQLRNDILDTTSLKGAMDGTEIRIFSGAKPASPDDAITGTLLVTIKYTAGDFLLDFETAATAGVLGKDAGQTWQADAIATGTASHFRHVLAADTDNASTTSKRIQGTVGVTTGDLQMSSISIVSGAPQNINTYAVTMPVNC